MSKKKRKPQQQRLPDKDVSKQESQESATKFSNPTSQGAHSDIPQSSVSQTKEASSQETLMKPMSDMKLSELPVQKDVQKYPEHSSGARPKTSAQPKREPKQQQLSAKDKSKNESQESAAKFSNPTSSNAHSNFRQSSVSQSSEVSQQDLLEKQISYVKISELPVQEDEQQYSGHSSGAKPKTLVFSGGKQKHEKDSLKKAKQKDDSSNIYTVLSTKDKVGKKGRKIQLRANHFPMEINVPGGLIYHYDVKFIIPDKKEVKKSDRKLLLETIQRLKENYQKIFHNAVVAFDGLKYAYTCEKLHFSSDEFEGEVEIKEHTTNLKRPEVKVILKKLDPLNVNAAIEEYHRSGTTETKPYDVIQALNIVLSMKPQLDYEIFGPNHFNTNPSNHTVKNIGGGASLWIGTFTSVRLGWKPMLNVDMANRVVYDKNLPLEEFIKNVLISKRDDKPFHISLNEKHHRDTVDEKIKNIKIQYSRPDGYKRDYRVIKMMPAANRLKMRPENGEECTIEKYFKDKYNHHLKFPDYPCIHVGKPEKTVYLPIELCMMKKQPLPTTSLTDKQRQKMISDTAKLPKERRATIERNLKNLSNYYEKDPYAKAFGLKVSNEMIKVDGRKLDPPVLKYKNVGEFRNVSNGKWRFGRLGDKIVLKFLIPTNLKYWGVLDLSNLSDEAKKKFVNKLRNEGSMRGMVLDNPIYEKANARNTSQVKETFTKLCNDLRSKKESQEGKKESGYKLLIMVINPNKSTIKHELKCLGDLEHKVPTQFVLKTNVTGRDNLGPSYEVLHNICLKINHKLGGVNHALWKIPPIMNQAAMVMGADVTHPPPRDSSQRPSIAAVVGSTDANVSQFIVEIRLQERVTKDIGGKSKVRVVEEIVQMEKIAYSLLLKFYQITQRKPEQIIYYRDGVSEGQFATVLKHEVSAIWRACAKLEPGYEPKVTFVIVQKRHKTRLFVENPNDGIGKTQDVPAGTVVDTKITTLSEVDFFLVSHEGIKVIIF